MWWFLAFIVFLIAAVHVVLPKMYHSRSFDRMVSKIPGPPTAFFIGTYDILFTKPQNHLAALVAFCNQYRPLRIDVLGSVVTIITDVKDVETVMNSKKYIQKSIDYELIVPWLGRGLLTSTGQQWFSHRRLLTPAFHFSILEPYLDIFSQNSRILIDKLMASNGKPVPILPYVSLCTLDIICETAMGKVVNAQQGGAKEYVSAVLEMSNLFLVRQLSPWLYREWTFKLSPTGRRTQKVLDILHGFTNKVIEEKREEFRRNRNNKLNVDDNDDTGAKKKKSFLDLLIEISEVEGTLTQQQIREETDTFMFEGHDTTATALSWALFELALNPQVQEAAFQELDQIFGDSDRDPTNADLAEMKYLERVIKETLRLYPSVPLIGRHLEQNITLSGYELPAGSNVAVFIYHLHRNPELYPEPDKFDPDRFLPERIAKRHPYSYIPFSAGPRNCIGQKFAMLEEKVVLSQILRKFKISSLTKREDLLLMAELILRPKDNVLLTFTPRNNQQ